MTNTKERAIIYVNKIREAKLKMNPYNCYRLKYLKIAKIDGNYLHLANGEVFKVMDHWITNHKVVEGGYIVEAESGYRSFSLVGKSDD